MSPRVSEAHEEGRELSSPALGSARCPSLGNLPSVSLPSTFNSENALGRILKGRREWPRQVMGWTLELAAADVVLVPASSPPCCVMLGKPLPSLGLRVPFYSFTRLGRMMSARLFSGSGSAAEATGPQPSLLSLYGPMNLRSLPTPSPQPCL